MAKQLNVNLGFTADTSQAKQQIQELQNKLSEVMSSLGSGKIAFPTDQLGRTISQVAELKTHLEAATNVDTGNLDFSKLSASLKNSGQTLVGYAQTLRSIGPEGQQAFMQLADAVSKSEIPIRKSNALLQEFATTLKNTARWQISSSVLHSFMGALQSAYGYAQDLNESLNNIRIVTGNSTEQMAAFAEQANKAAKALSTTTTEYTDAALIYYQQGLKGQDVIDRTDVTIKMANVTGESAEKVSQQLTAVWNNFNKAGDVAYERFADVMTKLGAETASSTDEIAAGLEKFAAVADTVGLSFDYAASALATITATTRQSADVVGTALKTIFARMESLKLGETLEDGTDLGSYAEQLAAVGVNIKNENGELKAMDDILSETGEKWGQLTKDQQVALAQGVAGVRQYSQFMALMSNWDFMKENLQRSKSANGTLEEQAKIYADSWESARDRVRAAWESVYSDLIDEDFFIDTLNIIEKIVSAVDKLIKSVGGLNGVLVTLGAVLTKTFSTQLAKSLNDIGYNLLTSTAGGRQMVQDEKVNTLNQMREEMALGQNGEGSRSGQIASEQYGQQLALQQELAANQANMDESQLAHARQLLDIRREIADQIIEAAQREEDAANKASDTYIKMRVEMAEAFDLDENDTGGRAELQPYIDELRNYTNAAVDAKHAFNALINSTPDSDRQINALAELNTVISSLDIGADRARQLMEDFQGPADVAARAYEELSIIISRNVEGAQTDMNTELGISIDKIKEYIENLKARRQAELDGADATARAAQAQQQATQVINASAKAMNDWASGIVSGAQGILSVISIIKTLSSAIDTLNNPDASSWDKFLAVLTAALMSVTMLSSVINAFSKAHEKLSATTIKNTLVTWLNTTAKVANAEAARAQALAEGQSAEAANQAALAVLEEATANTICAGTIWAMLWPILAVIVALAALGVGIYALIKAYNADADAAKESAAQTEELKNKYDELANSAKNLKAEISDYSDALKSLDDLTRGTDEYADALEKANEKATELIKTNNLTFGKDWTYGKDNRIEINQEALNRIQKKADLSANQAERNYYAAAAYNESAQIKSKATNLKRSIGSIAVSEKSDNDETIDYFRQFSTDELKQVGSALNELGDAFNSNDEQLKNYLLTTGKLTPALESNIDVIIKNKDQLSSFGSSVDKAAQASEAYAKKILGINIEEKYGDTYSQIATNSSGEVDKILYNQMLTVATEKAAKIQDLDGEKQLAAQEEASDQVSKIKGTGSLETFLGEYDKKLLTKVLRGKYDVSNDEELARTYAQMLGYGDRDSFTYQKGNNVGTITDAQGNKVLDNISDEVMRREIAKQVAMEGILAQDTTLNGNAESQMDGFNRSLSDLVSNAEGNEIASGIVNAILTSLSNADYSSLDLSSIVNNMTEKEAADFQDMDKYELLSFLGIGSNDLKNLGYESATQFYEGFKEAAGKWDKDAYTLTQNKKGEDKAESYGLDLDEFKEYRRLLKETYKEYEDNAKGLNEVAVANKRMERGVKALSDKWKDYNKIMSDTNASNEDLSSILPDVNEALGDILNLDPSDLDKLSSTFAKKNWKLIEDAVNGVEGAIDDLRDKAGEDILFNVKGNVNSDEVNKELLELHNNIMAYDGAGFTVGVALDPVAQSSFFQACESLINAAGMTASEAEAYLASIGYDAEVEKKEVPPTQQPWSVSYPVLDEAATEKAKAPVYKYTKTIHGVNTSAGTTALAIKSITPNGSYGGGIGVKTTSGGGGGSSGSGGGGGSSSKPKIEEHKDANEEIDRYHTLNKQLDVLSSKYDRVAKVKDNAFGSNKLKLIDQEINELDALIAKQTEYNNAVAKDVVGDRAAIQKYGFAFDENGTILNYQEVYEKQIQYYNEAIDSYNRTQNEETLETAKKEYEKFQKLLEQYEDTVSTYEDGIDELTDYLYEKVSKRLENITTAVEAKITLNDDDLKILDYYLNKISNRLYSFAEQVQYLASQIAEYEDNAQTYQEAIAKIQAEIINQGGKATEEQIEALREYQEALLSTNESLKDTSLTLQESLTSALEEAKEKLEQNLNVFSTYTSLLEHYNDIIDLSGKKTKELGLQQKFAAAATANAINATSAAANQYKLAQEARDAVQEAYNSALASGNEDSIEYWQKELANREQELKDSLDNVLDYYATALEAASSEFTILVDNTIQKLEKSIAEGYDTLDALEEFYNREKMLNDEYITANQQTYELNKLARQVEDSISNTQDTGVQKRLKDFINEVKDAYGKIGENGEYINEMSANDLAYTQKKYELLLAEIALEDARNNKTSMRLARDSSGNYNYIYTANQDEIDKAQQTYEDKLYEIQQLSENRISELSDSIISNRKEMAQALKDVNANDYKSWQDYQDALQSVRDDYLTHELYLNEELREGMKNLESDNGILTETIITNTVGIVDETEKLKESTDLAISGLVDAWITYSNAVANAQDAAGQDLVSDESIGDYIAQIQQDSNDLALTMNSDTEDMITYINQVNDAVVSWNVNWSASIDNMISKNELLVASIRQIVEEVGYLDYVSVAMKMSSGSDKNPYGGDIVELASGGYTGEWGPEGKLAVLHQKEVVLNPTQVDSLSQIIDLITTHLTGAANAQMGLISSAYNAASANPNENLVQQAVSIDASFPGVQSATEIENALNDLVNQAAQYAAVKQLA